MSAAEGLISFISLDKGDVAGLLATEGSNPLAAIMGIIMARSDLTLAPMGAGGEFAFHDRPETLVLL
jgi:hypothetical protein